MSTNLTTDNSGSTLITSWKDRRFWFDKTSNHNLYQDKCALTAPNKEPARTFCYYIIDNRQLLWKTHRAIVILSY